jgi:hypothetical protein
MEFIIPRYRNLDEKTKTNDFIRATVTKEVLAGVAGQERINDAGFVSRI